LVNEMNNTEKKASVQHCDPEDSLSSYMHMLETCNVISPEEEQELWIRLDDIRGQIRVLVYQFGFILSEHIKEINILDEKEIVKMFPYSVFSTESSDLAHSQHKILMQLRKWTEALNDLQIRQRAAYESGNRQEFESARAQSVQEMTRYPVLYEKIKEWERVAAVYAQDTAGNPDKLREFEDKLMMKKDEYDVLKEKINTLLKKNRKISEQILTANLRLVVAIIKKYQVKRDLL